MVREAFAAGQRDFGENYVQEAVAKIAALADLPATWHFIGTLQGNKAREVAERFDWVHGVDRARIAELLLAPPAGRAARRSTSASQVNISEEATKSGVKPGEALALARHVAALPGLRFRGLMGMASPSGDEAKARAEFAVLRRELEAIRAAGIPGDTLSMGMTHDFARGARRRRHHAAHRHGHLRRARGACVERGLRHSARAIGMKVTFLGGGNMGAAIIGGLVARGFPRGRHHRRSSPAPARASRSRARFGVAVRGGPGRRPAAGRRRWSSRSSRSRCGEAVAAARAPAALHPRGHHRRGHPHRGPLALAGRARRDRARHAQHPRPGARRA